MIHYTFRGEKKGVNNLVAVREWNKAMSEKKWFVRGGGKAKPIHLGFHTGEKKEKQTGSEKKQKKKRRPETGF